MTKEIYKKIIEDLVTDETLRITFRTGRKSAVIGTLLGCLCCALELTEAEEKEISSMIDDYVAEAVEE